MEATEVIAAIIAGWAVAWTMTTLGIDPTPSIIVGTLVWAKTAGTYRHRWATLARRNRPEPT